MQLALLCRGVNQRDVELAQAKHGPHAYAAIQVFMNAEAAAAMEAGKLRYPVGSVGKISSNPTYIIPMKQLASILAMAALAAFAAAAGTSSSDGDGSDFVIALSHPKTVAVSLPMPADYVSVQLRVSSDQKNAVAAHEESRQAIDAVVQKAKEGGQFKTTTGLVSLGQHASKFSMSSGSASSSPTGAEVFLLVPLQ